jgi:N utilization substance protein B
MLNFPQIPVPVTINEYVELANEYSTPKSGRFINGLLDAIAKENNFKIKKLI